MLKFIRSLFTKPLVADTPAAPKRGIKQSAVTKAREVPADNAVYFPRFEFKVPELPRGVVPEGHKAAIAMDDALMAQGFLGNMSAGTGFPGYPYLAQLATRAEFRAFASTLATEITREWIEFTSSETAGDQTKERIKVLEAKFKELDIKGVFADVAANDCYFGRGNIFIDIKGAEREQPLILSKNTIKRNSLARVVSVEPIWCTPSAYNALDPAAPDFYKPWQWFMLGKETHATRLLNVISRPLPDILKPAFNFSGMSLSQLAEPYVDNWLRTRQSVADLINNFSITALATSMDMVLQGDDDGADLFKRADLFTLTRSNRGLMLLDKDREELIQVNTPLSGLSELQSQSQEHMCSVSRIPAMILTGISPTGLNASSDGEIRTFYDWIKAQQEANYRFPLETIMKVIMLSEFGEIDPDINLNFRPLMQMTDLERAEIRNKDSATDQAYVDMGSIDPTEVREKVARDPNSGYQGLDVEKMPVMPDDDGLSEDASVSEAQHNAMEAAAHGHSTLGIPAKVGKEFVSKDA